MYDDPMLDRFPKARKAAKVWIEHCKASCFPKNEMDMIALNDDYCRVWKSLKSLKKPKDKYAFKKWCKKYEFEILATCI